MEKTTKMLIAKLLARVAGTVVFALLFGMCCTRGWMTVNKNGMMTALINDQHFELYVFSIGGALLGLFALGLSLIWWARRDVKLICLVATILFCSPLGWTRAKEWLTIGRFDSIAMTTDLTLYRPFAKGNILVKPDNPPASRMVGAQPRIDGVQNVFRYYASIVETICRQDGWMVETENSATAFNRIFSDEADVLFITVPSQAIMDKAAAKGKPLDVTPVVKDAFVFYVNARNPVENLSLEQLRQIYTGAITNWKDVGSTKNGKIEAFQRTKDSENQAVFMRIVGQHPLMEPPTILLHSPSGVVHIPADYRNTPNAIGYSYRSEAVELLQKKKIKLLAIDGVEPSEENIRNGSYPYTMEFNLVTLKDTAYSAELAQNIQKLRDFVFSSAGREIAEKCGLTPLPASSDMNK